MQIDLQKIKNSAEERIEKASTLNELENVRVEYLGREKGALTLILRSLKNLPQEERKETGKEANLLRTFIEEAISAKKSRLERTVRESVLQKEWLDVTKPGARQEQGTLHPLTKITREMTGIFSFLGFEIVEGPEVETEYYNFDALNIPANHPARDMWDTFWLKQRKSGIKSQNTKVKSDKLLLRTHTSPVQVRHMENHNPPIRIVIPGRVYRYEATDASHDIQFNQLEGLMVDRDVSIASFRAVIQEFFRKLFPAAKGKKEVTTRLRPSYFPFTEPSFEVDISCLNCQGAGCPVCKKSGWLEIAGAGMVHPAVFKAAGYNPKEVQGFAFGMGIDRIAMMKYKINDIRLFRSGDIRFLKQFRSV